MLLIIRVSVRFSNLSCYRIIDIEYQSYIKYKYTILTLNLCIEYIKRPCLLLTQ